MRNPCAFCREHQQDETLYESSSWDGGIEYNYIEPIKYCPLCGRTLKEDWEHPKSYYPIITLCGSTRFKDTFMEVQKKLTLEGNIVLSVGVFGHSDNEEPSEEQKTMLDNMHKTKIDMADMIYVINVDGYIGKSTQSEIDYATAHGKSIIYHVA